MPYPGVPANKTAKMERCVADLMAQGYQKSSAIAICHNTVVGKSKKTTKKTKKKI